jgi:hypothetical protein
VAPRPRRGATVERDWLASLLWPDSAEKQVLANLRLSLSDLPDALGIEAAIARERKTAQQVMEALTGLGRAALRRGDLEVAASRFMEVLSLEIDWRQRRYALPCLEGLASAFILAAGSVGAPGSLATVAAPSQLLCAARLLGAAAAVRERIGIARPPREQPEQDARIAARRVSLGDADFTAAWEAGRALSWEEVVACALER